MKVRRVDTEAEREVLGEILVDPGKLPTVRETITAADFYKPGHQRVFEALCSLQDNRVAIDIVTVCAELKSKGVLEAIGGISFVGSLTDGPADIFGVKPLNEYQRIIADNARARRIGAAARNAIQWAADETVEAQVLAERCAKAITEACVERAGSRTGAHQRDVCISVSEELDRALSREIPDPIFTGIGGLDSMLGGLKPKHLVVVAARPAVGKTSLVVQIAELAASQGKGVLFFSLEMSKEELITRQACARAHVPSDRINNQLSLQDHAILTSTLGDLSTLPIYWEDGGRVTASQITQRARAHAAREPLDLVIVDYLQKIATPEGFRDGRERSVAEAITEMKNLAKELKVTVIALAQVNRDPANREDTRPKMSDLRESGVIEAEADVVVMLWRDHEAPLMAEALVEKNRHGKIGKVLLEFVPERTRFEDRTEVFEGTPESYDEAPQRNGNRRLRSV